VGAVGALRGLLEPPRAPSPVTVRLRLHFAERSSEAWYLALQNTYRFRCCIWWLVSAIERWAQSNV